MAKFKVGDRVVCTCNYRVVPQGTIGTVVEIRGGRGDHQAYGVRWENFKKGHDLDGLLKGDESKTGWIVEQIDMQLLVDEAQPQTEKPPERKFKSGDRVITTVKYMLAQKGWKGTVLAYHKDMPEYLGVSFDGFANGHGCNDLVSEFGKPPKSGYWVTEECLQLLAEPVTEKPPIEPTKPAKPPKPKPWFAPIESAIDDLLEMSFEFKPASEWLMSNPYETAAVGNWTAPKPQEAASKPQPEPKKETKPKKDGCWKCTAYQQVADCGYGFCTSWHNFAGKDEFCSRFKAVETVDN